MKTASEIDKMSLREFVFFLNSLTTTELHEQFPGRFRVLRASDGVNETVKNMHVNDAILWHKTKAFAQKHPDHYKSLAEARGELIKNFDDILDYRDVEIPESTKQRINNLRTLIAQIEKELNEIK